MKQNSLQSIVPDLAISWSWNEDGTELTLPLREGVTWHDGKPFTAKDVVCTFGLLTRCGRSAKLAGFCVRPLEVWGERIALAAAPPPLETRRVTIVNFHMGLGPSLRTCGFVPRLSAAPSTGAI